MTVSHDVPVVLVLPDGTRLPSKHIADCEWKLQTFLERDAYAAYDAPHANHPPEDDRLERRHLTAINDAMRARSPVAAWEPFLGQVVPELAEVPRDLCLIHGAEEDVRRGITYAVRAVERFGSVRGLTDMAASKMLYLLRPRFISISDSYIRAALGLPEVDPPSSGIARSVFVRERFAGVIRGMRSLGLANLDALVRLEQFVDGLGSVTIAEDCQVSAFRWRGQQLPVQLSPVRILDILLWTEGAIRGTTPDEKWKEWAAARSG